jgi:hypothetical protein
MQHSTGGVREYGSWRWPTALLGPMPPGCAAAVSGGEGFRRAPSAHHSRPSCSQFAHRRCAYTRTSQHTSTVSVQVRHTATYTPGRDGTGWPGSNPGIPTARSPSTWASLRVSGPGLGAKLGRSGGRLAGHRWLGQGFEQRPDLGIGVASVAAQGTEIRQPALLRPATHRLWRHLEELGDLGCTEVPRLGWRWHRTLHSEANVPHVKDNPTPSGANAIQRSTQRASSPTAY